MKSSSTLSDFHPKMSSDTRAGSVSSQDLRISNFVSPVNLDIETTREPTSVSVIVPTFKPGPLTVQLVEDLLRFNQKDTFSVYVVDDCTPREYEEEFGFFKKLSSFKRVTLLRTPQNKMKAGAINYGLKRIFALGKTGKRDVAITLDDDVVVEKNTIKKLTRSLLADQRLGAVCSQCRVLNKNKNILTRLQGLEYLGFNATRLADEGFFRGPLVMHGMLTAFRSKALKMVGVFAEGHLIEDYEITARLKLGGWYVRLEPESYAWTEVPETIKNLWRQRVRWVYGGLLIATNKKYWPAIIQDLIGHAMFIFTFFLIIASFVMHSHGQAPGTMITLIIALSVVQTAIWYFFQIWFMRFYDDRDREDWWIRMSVVPEFIYANLLTLVLVGAYAYSAFDWVSKNIPIKNRTKMRIENSVRYVFKSIGYENTWGTRTG